MDKYVVELVGTFFLVLTIGLAFQAGALAPIAVAAVLAAVIYAGGHVSFAHYNPAVTLAFWRLGRCRPRDAAGYLVAQLGGAVLAALAVGRLAADVERVALVVGLEALVLAEGLFTFALCWVILHVALARGTANNGFYGLAIGSVVAGAAFVVGPISGAALNPAVSLGLCLLGLASWSSLGTYVLVQGAAAVLAAWVFGALIELE